MLKQMRLPARRSQSLRPDWARIEADHDYFCQALADLCEAGGFEVLGRQIHQDPLESQARECVFVLKHKHRVFVALGLRWVATVTSDVVGRFARGLRGSQASGGLILTTSLFTGAAVEGVRGTAIHLCDRHRLGTLLEAR